ncbi:hypothetical protein Tco_1410990 [Tanacetum coccineum]
MFSATATVSRERDGKIKIDKFDGHDFGFCKMQIEDNLYQKKLYEPLAEAKPTGMKAEDWTLLNRQALGLSDPIIDEVRKISIGRHLRVLELLVKCRRQRQGQKARQKQKQNRCNPKQRRDFSQEQAGYHVFELQPEGPLSELRLLFEIVSDLVIVFKLHFCKEELEKFRLRSGKVRLADDKTIDIAGVGDVVLKTFFGKSWTLKNVRYIPGLKIKLISVGKS